MLVIERILFQILSRSGISTDCRRLCLAAHPKTPAAIQFAYSSTLMKVLGLIHRHRPAIVQLNSRDQPAKVLIERSDERTTNIKVESFTR